MGENDHSRPFPLSLSRRYPCYFEFIRGRCDLFPAAVPDPAAPPEPFLQPALRNERRASRLHPPDDHFLRGVSAAGPRQLLRVVRRDTRVDRGHDHQAAVGNRDRPSGPDGDIRHQEFRTVVQAAAPCGTAPHRRSAHADHQLRVDGRGHRFHRHADRKKPDLSAFRAWRGRGGSAAASSAHDPFLCRQRGDQCRPSGRDRRLDRDGNRRSPTGRKSTASSRRFRCIP